MVDIPADAPRSDDGYYWWDGTRWQPVNQGDPAQQGTAQQATTQQAMTDDQFADMVRAAASAVREA
jgi:hypothetical protein